MERVTRGKEINKKGKEKTRWGVCTYRQLAQWNKPTPLTTVSLATLLWREREREREGRSESLSLTYTELVAVGGGWRNGDENGGRDNTQFLCCSDCGTTLIKLSTTSFTSSIILHCSFTIISLYLSASLLALLVSPAVFPYK